MKMLAFYIKVSGRVQGVGFRYSARKAALKFGISGWVRNSHDGSVEILCEGEENRINKFLSWLEMGPPGSNVSGIEKKAVVYRGHYTSFSIEF